MPGSRIGQAVKSGRLLVSDGGWGTLMQALGLRPGECPELWNLERREDIRNIARDYVSAGADMIGTNSFGANRLKLKLYGLEDRASKLNEAAAEISRSEAGADMWVLGSMGPTGKMLIMEDVTEDELYAAFAEQAEALERGGVDAACIETMSDLEEACIAVRSVKKNTGLEIICTFVFERTLKGEYRTMMGVTPGVAAVAMAEAGADIIGANCGNGMAEMIGIAAEFRAWCPELPIIIQANAGPPSRVDGRDIFPETPEGMAKNVGGLIAAGANIVGGCCGTTPGHIRAIKDAVWRLRL